MIRHTVTHLNLILQFFSKMVLKNVEPYPALVKELEEQCKFLNFKDNWIVDETKRDRQTIKEFYTELVFTVENILIKYNINVLNNLEYKKIEDRHYEQQKNNTHKKEDENKQTNIKSLDINSNQNINKKIKIIPEVKNEEKKSEPPTVIKMAENFVTAMAESAKTGFRRVTPQEHQERMKICNSCEFWDGKARMGMGKCNKCGCTGAKQWLASSSCPINLWGPLA